MIAWIATAVERLRERHPLRRGRVVLPDPFFGASVVQDGPLVLSVSVVLPDPIFGAAFGALNNCVAAEILRLRAELVAERAKNKGELR